jgi:hypothetical protein
MRSQQERSAVTKQPLPPAIDHLMYATLDFEATVRRLEQTWGVQLTPGGEHPDLGTVNALADLDGGAYLEVLGPKPGATLREDWQAYLAPLQDRIGFWVIHVRDMAAAVERARAAGYDPGTPEREERLRPDGVLLGWQFCWPGLNADPVVPFLIDWGSTPHPSVDSAKGLRLAGLRAEHPDPPGVRAKLAALGTDVDVAQGPAPRVYATLETPKGRFEIG